MMQQIFERFPTAEVATRTIYKKLLESGLLKKRIIPNEKDLKQESINIEELRKYLASFNIKQGDTLIVHSSMKGIRGFGLNPEEIIEFLKNIVGNEGTLLLPTYPQYPETKEKLTYDEIYQEVFQYDVNKTKAWTGMLTNLFWQSENVVRSHYPNNTLSAWGKEKKDFFSDEMESDLAFDKHSAWKHCVDRHAKVLFLGIHAHHSLSEIHIAEDYLDELWPIKGWYTKKKYEIKTDDKVIEKECRVRKMYWTKYMTEYYGCYRLRKEGLLVEDKIGNINVSVVPDLYEFEKYVEQCALNGDLLYFRIPGRYYKNGVKRRHKNKAGRE
ncbi:MAG: AAC(3) family N-acetyltransferase [Clostridiales bacterium]|nr:AAC(3) family N-acetyltransferase [Clostridiales bacterium]